MTEHVNTPAWQQSDEWAALIHYGHLDHDRAALIGLTAVAADRAHLATLIEALPDYDIHYGGMVIVALEDVLAVLRDAP